MIRCTEKHILHQKQGEKNVKFSNQGVFSFSSFCLVLYSFMRWSIRDGHRENRKEAQEKRESIIPREPRETVTLVHDRTTCGEHPGSGLSQAGGNQRGWGNRGKWLDWEKLVGEGGPHRCEWMSLGHSEEGLKENLWQGASHHLV